MIVKKNPEEREKSFPDVFNNNIDKIEKNLREKTGEWFCQELIKNQVYVLLHDLETVTNGLFKLADTQRSLAWILNDRQKYLARILINKALTLIPFQSYDWVSSVSQLDSIYLEDHIVDVARVPGFATMLLISPNTRFPNNVRTKIEGLLGEKLWFAIDDKNQLSVFLQAIGEKCDKNRIRIDEKMGVAHIPSDNLDVTTKYRVRLAQQLTGLHVMKQ